MCQLLLNVVIFLSKQCGGGLVGYDAAFMIILVNDDMVAGMIIDVVIFLSNQCRGGLVGYDAALTQLRSWVQFPFLV